MSDLSVATQAALFADVLSPDQRRGATFSKCRTYRYKLWDIWDGTKPWLLYVMLNPSTADEVKNDPTVERCSRRAVQMGYGGFKVVNIFALRSTDPKALYKSGSPISEHSDPFCNDRFIVRSARMAGAVICGWGTHGLHMERGRAVIEKIRNESVKPLALRMTKCGEPGHPLYIPYSAQPFEVPHGTT